MKLDELIKECDNFGALIKRKDKWAAAKQGQVLDVHKDFIHDTPEEAVIALSDSKSIYGDKE